MCRERASEKERERDIERKEEARPTDGQRRERESSSTASGLFVGWLARVTDRPTDHMTWSFVCLFHSIVVRFRPVWVCVRMSQSVSSLFPHVHSSKFKSRPQPPPPPPPQVDDPQTGGSPYLRRHRPSSTSPRLQRQPPQAPAPAPGLPSPPPAGSLPPSSCPRWWWRWRTPAR